MCPQLLSKPIELVEREATSLAVYDPRLCFIRDENFTMQRDWRERLAVLHRALPETKLYMFASANTINSEERARVLAENGTYMVCLGLEDPTKEYAKNRHLDEVVARLKRFGIYTYLSFIVNPLEIVGREAGVEFYARLMARFNELGPEMVCGNFLMPFRGTALWDKYYQYISPEDYRYYDSKTPFLVRNPVTRDKIRFFMFWYQWLYYTSDWYRDNVRRFDIGDTLHLRFEELYAEFRPLYERLWDVRP
jgi:hypothetical protein